MDPKYQSWFKFGTDHSKQDKPTLQGFLNHIDQPFEASAKKPELLYLTERHCTKVSSIPADYLRPGFDPRSLTCPKIRQVLAFNGIRYGADITKDTLVAIFNDSVHLFRSNNGIDESAPQSDQLTEMLRGVRVAEEDSPQEASSTSNRVFGASHSRALSQFSNQRTQPSEASVYRGQRPETLVQGPRRIPLDEQPNLRTARAPSTNVPQTQLPLHALGFQEDTRPSRHRPQGHGRSQSSVLGIPAVQVPRLSDRLSGRGRAGSVDVRMCQEDGLPAMTKSQRIVVKMLEELFVQAVEHIKDDNMNAVAAQLRLAAKQIEDDD